MPTRPGVARRRVGAVALTVVLAVTASGCLLTLDEEEPEVLPSPTLSAKPLPTPTESEESDGEAALQRYYTQRVRWKDCRTNYQCTEIRVPLDYAEPEGESITLALLKVPADSPGRRVGSLLVNPGGPGGSGIEYAANVESYFGSELRQAFDIVGFDPRGVGESTPVDCLTDDELDEYFASDPDPDNPAEREEFDQMAAEFGEGCMAESGEITPHVSTVEAARDIDIIRGVLGDRRLSWFGASYGTFLGATYADLFPQRVGRMVLDGAIDPSVATKEKSLAQAFGFERALRAYVGACVDRGGCFLGDSVDEGTRRIREFLDDVERSPIEGDGERRLKIGNAVYGIWLPLYNKDYWPTLDQALRRAIDGDGGLLLSLADAYVSRGPNGYLDNSMEAFLTITCLDEEETVTLTEAQRMVPEFQKASPTFGALFAYSLSGCAQWPVEGPRPPRPIDAPGAEPILVIGTSRDPATPVEWAEALASQLTSGVLVIREGDGHTAYYAGNGCVDNIVESYLVSGKVPRSGTTC